MPVKLKRRPFEDPNNTWNHQLMQACLQYNISEAEELLENGADPVAAREEVPFYTEPIPPLIALLLQGRYTTESVAMMNWLLEHGASASKLFPLQGKNFQTSPGEEGSILHLLVELGQFVQLMEVLALVGERRPPPISLQKRMQRDAAMSATVSGISGVMSQTRGGGSLVPGGKKRNDRLQHSMRELSTQSTQTLCVDLTLHLDGPVFDFGVRTSVHGWTVMDLALQCKASMAVQLLLYYGAPDVFHSTLNGSQTALARACATGDKELVEVLLDSGDAIGQLSLDGRYTLIHYAAAQPAVLDLLLARGLSINAKNALGESALVSLICYGQGANAEYAIREAPRPADVPHLAALPIPALRNYILTPLQPLTSSSGRSFKSPNVTAAGNLGDMDYPCITHDVDTWWYFAAHSNTWNMIQNLCDRGADVHGDLPNIEVKKLSSRLQQNKNIRSEPQSLTLAHGSSTNSLFPSEMTESLATTRVSLSVGGTSLWDPKTEEQSNDQDNTRPSMHIVTRRTPLMHAIVAYHPELIRRLLIEYHADPMVQDAQGACALHYAAFARHSSVMELMLSPLVASIHSNIDINVQDCRGRTPLHYAAAHGNTGVVRALLASGSTLNAGKVDSDGRTPLHLAVLAGEAPVVELFLQQGESFTTPDTISTSQGVSNRRRLTTTRRKGGRQIPAFVEVNASEPSAAIDVEVEDTLNGRTALEMVVCETHNVNIARVLLTMGYASLRHGSGLPTGGTLLHRTVADGTVEIMVLLLEKYADPNEMDNLEQTPLHLATQSTLPQACCMVRELLRFGALAEAQSGHTLDTPIIIAARRGDADMLSLLLHQLEEFAEGQFTTSRVGRMLQRERGRERDRARNLTQVPSSSMSVQNRRVGRYQQKQQQQQQQQQQQSRRGRARQTQGVVSSSSSDGYDCSVIDANNVNNKNGNINNNSDSLEFMQAHSSNIPVAGANDTLTPLDTCSGALLRGGDDLVEHTQQLIDPQRLLLTDGYVRTALHYLCSHGDKEKQAALLPLIQEILQSSLGPTLALQVDGNGCLPLHDACAAGYVSAAKELLFCDESSSAFFLDSRGCTPLHYAVLADDPDCIIELVQCIELWLPCRLQGAVSAVDDDRFIPVTSRILNYHNKKERQPHHHHHRDQGSEYRSRIIPLKAYNHRDIWIDSVWTYLNVHDGMGRTPLLLAAELGHRKASKTLMDLFREYPKSRCPSRRSSIDTAVLTAALPTPYSVAHGS